MIERGDTTLPAVVPSEPSEEVSIYIKKQSKKMKRQNDTFGCLWWLELNHNTS